MRHLVPILIGEDPLLREEIHRKLRPRVFPASPGALAAIDIALWDLAGRPAAVPAVGGARDRILSYASTPLFGSIDDYLRCVEERREQGFRAVKFHTWCLPEKDIQLCRAVRKHYPGDDVAFMHDAEINYDRESALRVE